MLFGRFLKKTVPIFHEDMALCEFSKLVGGPCSTSTDHPSNVARVSIGECDRDVKGHLKFCKISGDISVKIEARLLLARAGKQ